MHARTLTLTEVLFLVGSSDMLLIRFGILPSGESGLISTLIGRPRSPFTVRIIWGDTPPPS